jgi:NAD-dependent SIR2 family protein deacetylase
MAREKPDRNVYILGAGFSAPAGAPVIRNFLDYSREFYDYPRSSMDESEREKFANVFKFKRSMGQAREKVVLDLDNIEKLFGLVEISDRLGIDLGQTREDIVYLIAKTLQIAISWPKHTRPRVRFRVTTSPNFLKNLEGYLSYFRNTEADYFEADMYDYFLGLVTGVLDDPDRRSTRKDTIITFNYDLICDHSLGRLGVKPDYHLDAKLVTMDEMGVNSSGKSVDLLKLHGSTNWGICSKCSESVTILSQKITDDPYLFRTQICPSCKANAYQLLLVPPSWDKSEYQSILKGVWSKAVEELSAATRICIVGYSMPESDAFFEYLLTLALSQNDGLYKLIVIDLAQPQASEVEARYRKLLDPMFQTRRFSFHSAGVQGFLAGGRQAGTEQAWKELDRGEIIFGDVVLKDQ